jgi:hypothetical protein
MSNKATLTRWLSQIGDVTARWVHRKVALPLWDRQTSRPLNSAGLVIHGAGGTVPKTGSSDQYLLANGILQKIAASTDMPALSGTVTNAYFNVFCFFIDSGGTKTSAMGVQATTLAGVQFPSFPTEKALIGFVIINPTGTGDFVGGTTALDDATVVPNAAYVSPTGGFDPALLIGSL